MTQTEQSILTALTGSWQNQIKLSGNTNKQSTYAVVTDEVNGGQAMAVRFVDGVGFPALTSAQINALVNPQAGLCVFNTTNSSLEVYDGTAWVQIVSDSNVFPSDTAENWGNKADAGELPVGSWIFITDICDLGACVFCPTNSVVSVFGFGGYLNADYLGDGDYSGVAGFNEAQGLWASADEGGYVNGDCVVWNQKNFVVADDGAFDGTNPALNTTAYTELSKSVTNGYIAVWDGIEYSLGDNVVSYREDFFGNKISNPEQQNFDWGSPNLIGCTAYFSGSSNFLSISNVSAPVNFSAKNLSGDTTISIQENTDQVVLNIESARDLTLSMNNSTGSISLNVLGANDVIHQLDNNSGEIVATLNNSGDTNLNGNAGTILLISGIDATCSILNNPVDSEVDFTIGNQAAVSANDLIGDYERVVTIGVKATFTADDCTNRIFMNIGDRATCNISGSSAEYSDVAIGANTDVVDTSATENRTRCTFDYSGENLNLATAGFSATDLSYKYWTIQGSNLTATINFTGLGALDLSSYSWAGTIILTSTNPAETLTSIGTSQLFPFSIVPSNFELTITCGNTSIAADVASVVLDNTKGDSAVFQASSNGYAPVQLLNYYNNL